MESNYQPEEFESKWSRIWESKGYFRPSGQGKPYCMMMPPPNVTGTLHMGHAFQAAVCDALIRYHRMMGDSTLWQPGMDHAGIATQMVVERQLAAENKTRFDIGRDAFVDRVWAWKGQAGGGIAQQFRRMGVSPDWSRERFTMDGDLSQVVRDVFIRLYDEKLIYRGQRLVNWDPELRTAISDLEVDTQEEEGHLWSIRYPIADGEGHVVVATTRPETMLGDTAVAVHPSDERYQHLIGKSVILPLVGRTIPVIADEIVETEFGTGCLKITPAHDFNDYEVGQRHGLPLINVFAEDASLNDAVPEPYQGLDRFEARRHIVEALKAEGLLEQVRPYTVSMPRGDRTHTVIEPYLTDQWFLRVEAFVRPSIEAVRSGQIRLVPESWNKIYFDWMEQLKDWCISRQIWWGHRIPAWYDGDGGVYVGKDEAHVREKYGLAESVSLRRDDDVLDTWFSSALWPLSTLGWPEETPELRRFYPTSILVTAYDIIFFWVSRMIMMGLHLRNGQVPFREVFIHGLIRNSDGQKMSKSKGNVLDPLDFVDGVELEALVAKRISGLMQPQMAPEIEKSTRELFPEGIPAYGADALRFAFASLTALGHDVSFDVGRVDGYRRFCNKLWNAARFVAMKVPQKVTGGPSELSLADRWILARLRRAIADTHDGFEKYRFDSVSRTLYEFVWSEYCDWYLECTKVVLNDPASPKPLINSTRRTLIETLEKALRLLHPLIPFITEEIWQDIAPLAGVEGETIMLQPYPAADDSPADDDAEREFEWVQQFVLAVRSIRAEMMLPSRKPLAVLLQAGTPEDRERLVRNRFLLEPLGHISSIQWLETRQAPEAASALVGTLKILIPFEGVIDKEAEISRLDRAIDDVQAKLERTRARLSNPSFVDKAPAHVVEGARRQMSDQEVTLSRLQEQKERLLSPQSSA